MFINSTDSGVSLRRGSQRNEFARVATAVWHVALAWRRRRQVMGRLSGLSDRMLKDVGIHRSEVCSIAHWRTSDQTRRRNARVGG